MKLACNLAIHWFRTCAIQQVLLTPQPIYNATQNKVTFTSRLTYYSITQSTQIPPYRSLLENVKNRKGKGDPRRLSVMVTSDLFDKLLSSAFSLKLQQQYLYNHTRASLRPFESGNRNPLS